MISQRWHLMLLGRPECSIWKTQLRYRSGQAVSFELISARFM